MDVVDPKKTYESEFTERVKRAFSELGLSSEPIIEKPKRRESDLCLVCFPAAKELGITPAEAASRLQEMVGKSDLFELEVKGGYLNCTFEPGRYISDAASFLWSKRGSLGKGETGNEKIIVEHTSANPNGPFHVGRARNPVIGDTLVRLMRHAGFEVESQYWVNDMGKQVMILVWGLFNIDPSTIDLPEGDKEDHRLVRFYQKANAIMESDEEVERDINQLLLEYEKAVRDRDWERPISERGNTIRARDVRETCDRVLSGMKTSLSRLNVGMDRFVYESQVVEDGSLFDVIERLKKSPLCREEDGAYYLDLSGLIEGGDEERFRRRFVFTRSDGSALYTTRDLAYHRWKLSRCHHAINVLGEDHRYQSLMLELALRELGLEKVPEAVFYSFVSLPEGKMSTRRGRTVYLDDLLDEAVQRAREEVEKRRKDLKEEEIAHISEVVGIGALRFNMIRVQPEKKIVFRWEEALNFEGSSAPFIQYSHARACSILEKGGMIPGPLDFSRLVERAERELVKQLSRFDEVVSKAARERRVHLMATYLVDTASSFNDFYRDCPVLSENDERRRGARLALVELSREVFSSGLSILGIEAPASM